MHSLFLGHAHAAALPVHGSSAFCSPSTLRRNRLKLGVSIGRKRLVKKYGCVRIRERSMASTYIGRCSSTTQPSSMGVRDAQFLSDDTIVSAQYDGHIAVHRLAIGNNPTEKARKILDLPPPEEGGTKVKLFPLSDGTSFAVGLPNGDYRIYSGEGAKWSSPSSSSCNPDIASTPLSPFYAPFYTTINHINGVCRRYHRKLTFPLWESRDGRESVFSLSEIRGWETKRHITRPNSYQWMTSHDLQGRAFGVTHDYGWAFHETGSTLYAAFVDPERDCFSIMDHRVSGPVLCCPKPLAKHDDFTACCFLPDHALATSNEWQHHWTDPPCNTIRVWDLRSVKRTPATEHTLSSFPRDSIATVESAAQWNFAGNLERFGKFGFVAKGQFIKKLDPSRTDRTIMITLGNPNGGIDLIRYDYIQDTITFQQSWLKSTVVAIAPNNDYVCTALESHSSHYDDQLSLWDPLQPCSDSSTHPTYSKPATHVVDIDCVLPFQYVRTCLVSLAWNATGTSLVGGTYDGKIFIWDADDYTER